MSFDPTKPVQTRDGRKARIICTDRNNGNYPIVALIGKDEDIYRFTKDGLFFNNGGLDHSHDLINILAPFEFERWVNVYRDGIGVYLFKSQESANDEARTYKDRHDRIACVRVTIRGVEGEGL